MNISRVADRSGWALRAGALLGASLACAAGLGGCKSSGSLGKMSGTMSGAPHRASEGLTQDLLGTVQKMAGSWEQPGENDVWSKGSTFSVSSAGSVVREVMFAGAEHEMTNMYHMDGDSLVMTHYCAMGNQPRMRCRQLVRNNDGSVSLPFVTDGVTNLGSANEMYMGQMTLTLMGDGTAKEEWRNIREMKTTGEHDVAFLMRRTK